MDERKLSKSFSPFDILAFSYKIVSAEGAVVVTAPPFSQAFKVKYVLTA